MVVAVEATAGVILDDVVEAAVDQGKSVHVELLELRVDSSLPTAPTAAHGAYGDSQLGPWICLICLACLLCADCLGF